MVTISCSGKLHAFALAEQMAELNMLDAFYTTYAYQVNKSFRKLAKRIDKEQIPAALIHTNMLLAFPAKLLPARSHTWNTFFDRWVAGQLKKSSSGVFIGWSGMSLHALRQAHKMGMKTIIERGSTHIGFQDEILREEYKRFGKDFSIEPAVVEKELAEYEEADYISVPSFFVKETFIARGVPERKLLLNPYGASNIFKPAEDKDHKHKKFTIIYLGTLSVQKGLIYFFEALQLLSIPENNYEAWFIGSIEEELQAPIARMKKDNWKFYGHVPHYELPEYLAQCDVGIQPSLQEGLSMVILQLLASGIPVIATPNSGAMNVIKDGMNGKIIPIRSPEAIKEAMEELYTNRQQLKTMQTAAAASIKEGFTWKDYGMRYKKNLETITQTNRPIAGMQSV